jgi:hypothetical protein
MPKQNLRKALCPGQTHLNCCNPLKINNAIFNSTPFSSSGERTRPRVQRATPRGPHQERSEI